ncbi:MAG TPA: TAXI family TRAP transporter solute-binding subunit [Stellaceae bacterium]|nr:TAXI family TRAP transporter solute-binding subunit [Stellaceae bacterium]
MATRIATAEEGGTFWTQGQALKSVLERDPALAPVEVVASPGASIATAEELAAGKVAFGFMAANWVPRARAGEAPFARPLDLRIVAPMNAGPLFFIARFDRQFRSVRDLAGKRVVFGPEKSGMAQHARLILDLLGLAATPLYLDFAAGAAAVESGEADAQLQCPIPNRVMTELSERCAIRVLPWDHAGLVHVLASVPFYRRATMPRGALRGLDADTAQPGVLNLLVTSAGTEAALVAACARAIAAGADELARRNLLFAGLPELLHDLTAIPGVSARFHEGALSAYRELRLLP